jgi:hypothetical protein
MSQDAALLSSLKNGIREEVRKEVLADELGAVTTRLAELSGLVENGFGQIGTVLQAIPQTSTLEKMLSTISLSSGGNIALSDPALRPTVANPDEEEEEGPQLAEGEIIVDSDNYNNVLDFINAHAMLQRCFIDRRPVNPGVRSQYTADADPQIAISMRTGGEELGVDHHMRTAWLTLKTDAEEGYVHGEYWERFSSDNLAGDSIQMAPDQVNRIIAGCLRFARKALGKKDKA